jgi:hypothetical protein
MIVGLVGFAGSGKGTVADVLVDKHNFTKLSFADSVKNCVASVFGWPRHLLEGDTDPSRTFREKRDDFWSAKLGIEVTPRWALQTMGTEAGRDVFHKDIWIYSLEKRLSEHKNVVIADVRFPNEIDFIKEKGGFIVRVVRGSEPVWYETALLTNTTDEDDQWIHYDRGELMENKYPDIHVSEWAWIGSAFHYQLYNNGTKTELESNVKYMLTCFTGPVIVKSVA